MAGTRATSDVVPPQWLEAMNAFTLDDPSSGLAANMLFHVKPPRIGRWGGQASGRSSRESEPRRSLDTLLSRLRISVYAMDYST